MTMSHNTSELERLKAVVARLRGEYAGDPNIRAIGWGLKRAKGSLTDELAIIVHVRTKLPSERTITAAGSRPIPREVEGFPTDIEQSNPAIITAGQRDDRQYDPLVGGPATSNAEGHIYWFNGFGTLGMLVRNAADNAPMALSNWHVWADGGNQGDRIIQPGHPTTGDHLEGIGKVAACGPLLAALIEWEAPSPLAAGLYGGAAAAAVAAALSDARDPMRRGQDATPPEPDESTLREDVRVAIDYPQLPLPGRPFRTDVKWDYRRHTDRRVLEHAVREERVNTQFLLGKMVVTDRASYRPGEVVELTAAIWDWQARPCDAYLVVAHLLPHNRPGQALRVVLHPSVCPRTIPPDPPEEDGKEDICLDFEQFEPGEHPHKGTFDWLAYASPDTDHVRIVTWHAGKHALLISFRSLRLRHAPTGRVRARVAQYTDTPVTMVAFDATGQPVGEATAPNVQGSEHVLEVAGEGILGVVLRGGGGEGLLIEYCIEGVPRETLTTSVPSAIARGITAELPHATLHNNKVRATRCCFTGGIRLPAWEAPGKWDVHLVVQNLNHQPEGLAPEEAATVIGGHLLSAHAAEAALLGCGVIMLLDHVFDVI
jgi:hypothetical protein